jgi:hypothetical protein
MPLISLETLCGEPVEVHVAEGCKVDVGELKLLIAEKTGINHLTQQIYRSTEGETLPDGHRIADGDKSLVLMVVGEMVCVRVYSRIEMVAATAETTPQELLAQLRIQYADGELLFKGQILPKDQPLRELGVIPRIIAKDEEKLYEKGNLGLFGNPEIKSSTLHYVIPDSRFF